ncbi:MAG: TcfC E-set like domain-containing protein [Bacillota bacterium]
MKPVIRGIIALLACLIPASPGAASSTFSIAPAKPPPGFENLDEPRQVDVDLYFGGRKVGDAMAVARAGSLAFQSPGDVVSKIPNVKDEGALAKALTGDLPANSDLVCSKTNAGKCGAMLPEAASIIYDEDRFRVDLFVNPRFLETIGQGPAYLPVPTAPPSLTSSVGVALSGSTRASPLYNVQNRTVVALRNARVRMSSSVASRLGWIADDLVAEVDRRNMRYSAGLFWAPGMDFTGQRRIVGAGFGTQFDTLADREGVHGTPLILFLAQPARVEILVEGRLVTSGAYEAGNNQLDTSALPNGAYSVLLRIHEASGAIHEERRFFVKNAQVAPLGRPVFFGYAGLLANTRRKHLLSASRTPFYQLGTAWRLNSSVAIDAGLLGSNRKSLLELGGWLMTPAVRVRAAVLASTRGDKGALVQLSSGAAGPLSFTFDLRRISTHRGEALFPLPSFVASFDSAGPAAPQLGNGSYTQATGSLGYRLGPAILSIVGSYRRDRGLRADYSIGPSLDWPLLNRNGLQLIFHANAQRTSSSSAAFAGFNLMVNSGRLAIGASAGASSLSQVGASERSVQRAVGSLTAQYSPQTPAGTELSLEAGADRNIDSTTARANGTFNSRLGNVRADLLHSFGAGGATQYGVTFQSAAAASMHGVAVGANELEQSAVIISVAGDASNVPFDVLVDEAPRGRIRVGERISLFLPAYRSYKVRLVPSDADPVMFDASTHVVTLYPGNVETLRWKAQSYFTVFGQAVGLDGKPITDALVKSARGVSETDANGYFQIDVVRNDAITIGAKTALRCRAELSKLEVKNDYAALGKVLCK